MEHSPPRITTEAPAARILTARAEIQRMRAAGYGRTEIARTLNIRGVPTPSGRGQWWADTVRRFVEPQPWSEYMRDYRARRRSS
jgi:hypothetical protein